MRYVSALEQLFDQVTLNLIAARGELVRRAPARRDAEPDTDNPVVLFGHPIDPLRSALAINQSALVTPEALRRLLGTHSNGIVANNSRDGHHHYPNPVVPQPPAANSDGEARGETSAPARPAHLHINEVD